MAKNVTAEKQNEISKENVTVRYSILDADGNMVGSFLLTALNGFFDPNQVADDVVSGINSQ